MNILGVDSSGLVASIAYVEDGVLIGEYTIQYKKTHSQTLMPMLDELKRNIELDLNKIDGIAVAAGPGSFTGLRIGAASVKGLCLALNKPVIPVSTLEGLAYNLWASDDIVCPIMDARRQKVYTAAYRFASCEGASKTLINREMIEICDKDVISIEEMTEKINQYSQQEKEAPKRVVFLGDGVPVYRQVIDEVMQLPHYYAPATINRQRASSIATLGEIYMEKGLAMDADLFSPDYLRLSQAERERKEREEGVTT